MHVHLIGIAGTAMTALARLLVELGHHVSGSDQNVYPPMSTELERLKIPVHTPYAAANLGSTSRSPSAGRRPDLVVVGNAIARGNPELEACLDLNLPYTSQAEAIEDLWLPGRTPVVVTGTHGKTTTSALLAWVLRSAGRDPGYFVGGVPLDLEATSAVGTGPEVVLEGDEYDTAYFDKRPKFHHYRPRILVVNNLEHDHADIYPDLESIALEFRRLVNTVPQSGLVLVGTDSAAALEAVRGSRAPILRFGLEGGADLRALDLQEEGAGMSFRVVSGTDDLGSFTIGLSGIFNVRNALAAIAVGLHLSIPAQEIARALASFRGVKRRLELRGTAGGVAVFDDFAHHPTAIRATIEALRGRGTTGRIWAVLEPRSWSMRRNLHQATLPVALAAADVVVMAPVFELDKVPAGLGLDVALILAEVAKHGLETHAIEGSSDLARLVAEGARAGDSVLIMSNGGFDGAHEKVLEALARRT